MKANLIPISPYDYDTANTPVYEVVFVPTLTTAVDDAAAATELTASIDIDGTIYYEIYESSATRPSTAAELKADAGVTEISTTANTVQTIGLIPLALSAGSYVAVILGENDYDDNSGLTEVTFDIGA